MHEIKMINDKGSFWGRNCLQLAYHIISFNFNSIKVVFKYMNMSQLYL